MAILSYRLSSRLAWAIRNLGRGTPNKTHKKQNKTKTAAEWQRGREGRQKLLLFFAIQIHGRMCA